MINSQMHAPWPTVGQEPWVAERSPAVYCEILPVALSSGQIYYLRRRKDGVGGAWHEPHVHAHPSELVRTHLEAFLGFRLDPQVSVVHSTAWRYECGGSAGGRLILTYLVVLAPMCCLPISHLSGQISLDPLPMALPVRSETLMPPARIGLEHVLAHALDHLTLLMETDEAIQTALGDVWRTTLRRRMPRPAGELRLAQ